MKRVHIICEGQTEETFVNEVLRAHLVGFNVIPIASLVGKPGHKGGCVTTARMEFDIRNRLLSDKSAWCTTFFDFYGLNSNFIGMEEAATKKSYIEKAQCVESALKNHMLELTGSSAIRRFLPYVQMYEFEGLLFSDPAKLVSGINAKGLEVDFREISSKFISPEEINDVPMTAPSKRILKLMPSYDKPLHGSLAAIEKGLDTIRRKCRRFNDWIQNLENVAI